MSSELRILLIDSSPERALALEQKFLVAGFSDVFRIPAASNLVEEVARQSPDIVIIDMAIADRDALEGVRELSARSPRPVVMFTDEEDPAFAEQAIAAGVCSYNLSGVATRDVKLIVTSAIALFRRYRDVESELAETKTLLTERRLIERAKALLMRDRSMTEPEAYAWLRRKAMNANRKIAQIAADLLEAEVRHGRAK